jgi:hypothetical protein
VTFLDRYDRENPPPVQMQGESELAFDRRWKRWTGARTDALCRDPEFAAECERRRAAGRLLNEAVENGLRFIGGFVFGGTIKDTERMGRNDPRVHAEKMTEDTTIGV